MNIHKPNIRVTLACLMAGLIMGSEDGASQTLEDPNQRIQSADHTTSEIITDPGINAYTPEPLIFVSDAKSRNGRERSDSQLPGPDGPEADWDRLQSRYRIPGTREDHDLIKLVESVRHQIHEHPERLRQVVEIEITANPTRVCEIVKAAIKAAEADERTTASMVEIVAHTSPENLRLAAQCAIAVNPAALREVQVSLARVDPGAGESSSAKASESAKGSKQAPESLSAEESAGGLFNNRFGNPLDLPDRDHPIPPFSPEPSWIPAVTESDPG